jgi:hypothetical protein
MRPFEESEDVLGKQGIMGLLGDLRGTASLHHPLSEFSESQGGLGPDLSHGGLGCQAEEPVHQDPFHGPIQLHVISAPEPEAEHVFNHSVDHLRETGKIRFQGLLLDHSGRTLRMEEEGEGHVGRR